LKEIVWARIGENSRKRFFLLAEKKEISVSEYIRHLVLQEIEQKGGES